MKIELRAKLFAARRGKWDPKAQKGKRTKSATNKNRIRVLPATRIRKTKLTNLATNPHQAFAETSHTTPNLTGTKENNTTRKPATWAAKAEPFSRVLRDLRLQQIEEVSAVRGASKTRAACR